MSAAAFKKKQKNIVEVDNHVNTNSVTENFFQLQLKRS